MRWRGGWKAQHTLSTQADVILQTAELWLNQIELSLSPCLPFLCLLWYFSFTPAKLSLLTVNWLLCRLAQDYLSIHTFSILLHTEPPVYWMHLHNAIDTEQYTVNKSLWCLYCSVCVLAVVLHWTAWYWEVFLVFYPPFYHLTCLNIQGSNCLTVSCTAYYIIYHLVPALHWSYTLSEIYMFFMAALFQQMKTL